MISRILNDILFYSTDQNERQIESQAEEVRCVIRAFVSRLQQSVQVSFGVFVKL